MKAVILAGGFGTRISEESGIRPKPMVEVGGMPILWHIMKIYSHYGLNDFIICCGYKANVIKEYFSNYFLHNADVTFDMKSNSMKILKMHAGISPRADKTTRRHHGREAARWRRW
jgi:glucose-1-phosphate cytidylyltransferase